MMLCYPSSSHFMLGGMDSANVLSQWFAVAAKEDDAAYGHPRHVFISLFNGWTAISSVFIRRVLILVTLLTKAVPWERARSFCGAIFSFGQVTCPQEGYGHFNLDRFMRRSRGRLGGDIFRCSIFLGRY